MDVKGLSLEPLRVSSSSSSTFTSSSLLVPVPPGWGQGTDRYTTTTEHYRGDGGMVGCKLEKAYPNQASTARPFFSTSDGTGQDRTGRSKMRYDRTRYDAGWHHPIMRRCVAALLAAFRVNP